jgi:hypothetical protein
MDRASPRQWLGCVAGRGRFRADQPPRSEPLAAGLRDALLLQAVWLPDWHWLPGCAPRSVGQTPPSVVRRGNHQDRVCRRQRPRSARRRRPLRGRHARFPRPFGHRDRASPFECRRSERHQPARTLTDRLVGQPTGRPAPSERRTAGPGLRSAQRRLARRDRCLQRPGPRRQPARLPPDRSRGQSLADLAARRLFLQSRRERGGSGFDAGRPGAFVRQRRPPVKSGPESSLRIRRGQSVGRHRDDASRPFPLRALRPRLRGRACPSRAKPLR